MDTRTGEIFEFQNEEELEEAIKNNPYLIEVNCDKICEFREERRGKFFCIANRKQRWKIKCQNSSYQRIYERLVDTTPARLDALFGAKTKEKNEQ